MSRRRMLRPVVSTMIAGALFGAVGTWGAAAAAAVPPPTPGAAISSRSGVPRPTA